MSTGVKYQPCDVVNGHRLSDAGTHWIPAGLQSQESTGDDQRKSWILRHKVLTGVIGAGALLLTVGAISSGGADSAQVSQNGAAAAQSGQGEGSTAAGASSSDQGAAVAEEPAVGGPVAKRPAAEEPVAEEPAVQNAAPVTTVGQDNALRAAENYLEFAHFSSQGLTDQLSSEYGDGYSVKDATWAVAQLNVDWKEQAVGAGEDYLEMTPFSRDGLIEQLSSAYGDQFTVQQATYAADTLGL